MKVMATFDRSSFSESILPLLSRLAGLPEAEFLLYSVADEPHGRRESEVVPPARAVGVTGEQNAPAVVVQRQPALVENKEQAVERRLAETRDYLDGIGRKLPAGARYVTAADVSGHPAETILAEARKEQPDVIVMATHGHSGIVHALVGSVAERVVRAGVAPVLLVHPEEVKKQRDAGT